MGYTLDQLLDETGVNRISGAHLAKQASEPAKHDLMKLADRCRAAVNATDADHEAAAAQGLVEKTASVAVIRRAMAEISAIDNGTPPVHSKTASSEHPGEADFVAAALEQGHSPEAVADFLEKNAFLGRAVRGVQNWRAARGARQAGKTIAKGDAQVGRNFREWQDIVQKSGNLREGERAALVSRMQRELGAQSAMSVFTATNAKGFKDLDAYKSLQKAVPKAAATGGGAATGCGKAAVGLNVGDKSVGLSSKQLDKVKKPALYLGGGALAHRAIGGGGKDKPSGKRGVVVVNS